MRSKTVRVGDAAVEILLGPKSQWLGLGRVAVGDVPLRDGRHPMVVRVDTPDGILYTQCFLDRIEHRARGAVDVHFRAVGIGWGRREYLDEYTQAMVDLARPDEPVEDRLTLKLAPASLELGGRQWTGLSYAIRFASRTREIHRVLVIGSWELGGSIAGNTVLSQGQCNMPVYRGAKRTLFTTACLKTLDQYGSPQGVSYQLGPRGGLVQGFDFQHGREGTLLQYWPKLDAISSVLESPAGSTRLHVVDEYRFPLARTATTTPQVVLFAPGKPASHEARDLWWQAQQHVYGQTRRRYGVRESIVRPEMGCEHYSTRLDGETLKVTILGEEVDADRMLHLTADRLLPRLAEQGIRRFFPIDAHQTDVTELGMVRKLDSGIHGDLICASVCASHRYFPSEFWGGIEAWRYMAERARSLDIEIGCWLSPHFAPRAEIFREHPDWLLKAPDSLHWGGGYGQAIVTADWNTGVYDWVLADIKRWVDEGGLDYIFIDSWANMGLVQYNCADRMRANFDALGRLLGAIQALGVRAYTFEGISPFGASRFGVTDLRGDLLGVQAGVAGQNDFGWWTGELDMAFGLCMHAQTRKRPAAEVEDLQFRTMANRGYLMLPTGPGYQLSRRLRRLNAIYEQALPHMVVRRLLPRGAGVRWQDGRTQIVWAYRDATLPIPAGAAVERLTGAATERVACGKTLRAKAGCVYRIK